MISYTRIKKTLKKILDLNLPQVFDEFRGRPSTISADVLGPDLEVPLGTTVTE